MPVNYNTPPPDALFPVPGVRLGVTAAGIRKQNRPDLTVIALDSGTSVAGVFTKNQFCAAPVILSKKHLSLGEGIRALVINTGNANAGTGEAGMRAAEETCASLARLLNLAPTQILPFSTGVILESLPVDRLLAGLPACVENLAPHSWHAAAHGIMTTDTVAKAYSKQVLIQGKTVTITGMCKGAGMIRPNMATMLAFVATDAGVSETLLQQLVKEAADESFNAITVDGDTSTNDSFIVMATGQSGFSASKPTDAGVDLLRQALIEVSLVLAQSIIRDAEGATKFITIAIEGGRNREECRRVGYAIGHSPLIKTAFFASDPNLGRILAAIGYAGVDALDVNRIRVWLASEGLEVLVAEEGGRAASYQESTGAQVMQAPEITVRVNLARGEAAATLYSCDFSYDYVKINADYRT